MELVVYLQDETDLAILESLLRRLKLRFEKRKDNSSSLSVDNDREKKLLELRHLAAQIQESSYGDPIEWQREIRKDHVLPFREG